MSIGVLFLAALLQPAAPSDGSGTGKDAVFVTVEQLARSPERWRGRRVRVSGLAVREFENYGLYRDYDDYCGPGSHRDRRKAIYVQWTDAFVPVRRFRRRAVIEGVFTNTHGQITYENGQPTLWLSNAAPGPGPLTDARLVRWTSGMIPECGRDRRRD